MPTEITNLLTLLVTGLTTGGGALWIGTQCAGYLRERRRVAEVERKDQELQRREFKEYLMAEVRNREADTEHGRVERTAFRAALEAHNHASSVHFEQHRELITVLQSVREEFRDFNSMLKVVHRQHRQFLDPETPAEGER